MLRRPFCGMAVCFLLGIWGAAYLGEIKGKYFIFAVAIVWLLAFGFLRYLSGDVRVLRIRSTLCIVMLCMGFFRYGSEQIKRDSYLPYLPEGKTLTVQGEVAGKQLKNNQYIYELTSCFIGPYQYHLSSGKPIVCNRILAYSNSDVASIGEILVLNGTIELWENAVNEGNFDAQSFYLARKTDFQLRDIKILTTDGNGSRWKEKLFQLRLRLKEVYQTVMAQEACGVLTTMVLGDKSLLDAKTKRLYQQVGLSHIMAISGLHISVIGMTLYQSLRKRGLGFGASGTIAGILLYGYGTMVGMGTSVERSIGMFMLLLLAQTIGRSYDSLNALGIMALVLLWKNPYLLWDAGFQFSFVAILGVVWMGRCISFSGAPFEKKKEKLFISLTAQLATLPLVIWYYYEVSPYALVINLTVLPFVGGLLSLGVIGGMVGLLSMKAAGVLLFFCEKFLNLMQILCEFCVKLPYSIIIIGRPELWQVVFYYVGMVGLALLAYRKKERFRENEIVCTREKRVLRGRQIAATLVAFVFLIGILTYSSWNNFELDILDVGQGDGIFLQTEEGYHVFVDGGSTTVKQVGTYRILPFLKYKGVRQIDFWIVSHTDEDHISGLREAFEEHYAVRYLVFWENILQDEAYKKLESLAEMNGTEILYVAAGDTLHLGGAKIHVLYPEADPKVGFAAEKDKAADKNASSLVVLYEEGDCSAIFTGDIGKEQERELSAMIKATYDKGMVRDRKLEFYKAAHHGSKYSNSAELLNILKPEIAAVSCARRNSYGHPGTEAIKHMEEAGSRIFYTMEAGEIKAWRKKGKVCVQKYKAPLEFYTFDMLE